jgi:ankyrin repeat protein
MQFETLFICAFVLFVAMSVYSTVKTFLLRRNLKARGKRATAAVVDLSVSRGTRRRRRTTYHYTLEYTAGDERLTVHYSSARELAGDTVEIAYLPEDPRKFLPAESLSNSLGYIAHLASRVVSCLVGLMAFVFAFYGFSAFDSPAKTLEFINFINKAAPWLPGFSTRTTYSINIGGNRGVTNARKKGLFANTPLMDAAGFNSDPGAVNALIQAGAAVNEKNIHGESPLMLAASNNKNHEVLIALILASADVNASDHVGRTALLLAAARNSMEVLNVLIEAGADTGATDNNGETALFAAARNKNPEVISSFIQGGADIEARNNAGRTPFIEAAASNGTEVLDILIKAGADTGAVSYSGETALMAAAWSNTDPEVIKMLIQGGANVNAKDETGFTPLTRAVRAARYAFGGNTEVLNVLIEAGADIEAKDNEGKTALTHAAKDIKPEVMSVLLDAGANVSESDAELAQNNKELKGHAVLEELISKTE